MKNYTLEKTSRKHIARVVDTNGDWQWYKNTETGEYKRGLTTVLGRSYPKGEGFYEALKKATPDEWDRKLEAAGDRGDAIHQAIHLILSGAKFHIGSEVLAENNVDTRRLTLDEWRSVLAFSDFCISHGVKVIASEETLEADDFVGTADQIWVLTKKCDNPYCKCEKAGVIGKILLNDVKTGKGLYDNHASQVALLSTADLTHLGKLGKVQGLMLLHLNKTKRGWTTDFLSDEEVDVALRKGAAAFVMDEGKYRQFTDEDIEDIPETIDYAPEPFKKTRTAKAVERGKKKVAKKMVVKKHETKL